MYLLYLDDSGSSNNNDESHVILGGVIIPEDKLYWVNKNLNELCESLNIIKETEFHASVISGGRKNPWNKFERIERYNIIKNVLKSANYELNNIIILACAVEKNYFPNDDPMLIAFEDICGRFQYYLERQYTQNKKSSNGLIILDESSYKETFQGLVKQFQTTGNKWQRKLNDIQEAPMFVDSKVSRGIQLADHVAYAIFRRYVYNDLNYYNVVEGYFDTSEGKIHGLSHKTGNKKCTCAPCSQKRITH